MVFISRILEMRKVKQRETGSLPKFTGHSVWPI